MEVKINREIRNYSESVFMGLSLRQFLFSLLACGTTILLYFISKTYFGKETLSWICVVGAIPFALLGFFKYNGMPAEKVLISYIQSEFLIPKKMVCKSNNFYYELLKNRKDDAYERKNG